MSNPLIDYYVDPTSGSDSNGGTSDVDAWLTLEHAIATITRNTSHGDRINVKAGGTDTL